MRERELSTTQVLGICVRKIGGLRDCKRGKVKAREDAEFNIVLLHLKCLSRGP